MPTKIADRVAELERNVAELQDLVLGGREPDDAPKATRDGWRETVGAYEGSAVFDAVVRRGQAWRRRQPKC